jgi:hypothetical protein
MESIKGGVFLCSGGSRGVERFMETEGAGCSDKFLVEGVPTFASYERQFIL